jgi:alpha-ketoglutarate-dependent taurine dioxygenase
MDFYKKITYSTPELTKEQVQTAIETHKLVHIVNFDHQIPIHQFYTDLSDALGWVDEDKETGNRWIDISYDPTQPDKYRSSNTRQPLHTDNSYLNHYDAVNYFYCVAQASLGGGTIFLDSELLIRAIEIDQEHDLLRDLQTIPVCFSRHENQRVQPILTKDDLGYCLNYNYYRLDQTNSVEAKELVERFQVFLEQRVFPGEIAENIILTPGDAVFFHDERLLHGRTAFFTSHKNGRVLIKGSVILNSRKYKNLHLDNFNTRECISV